MTIAEGIVARHLEHCHARNLAEGTIRGRRLALARLSRWADGPILYLGHRALSDFQIERSRTLAPASRRGDLSHIRAFYRWCVREGYLDLDPTDRMVMPRAPRRFPRPMPDDHLRAALIGADPETAVILGLAGFAGLRACEIARLDWSEVTLHTDPPMLHVARGKGDRSRTLPISPPLAGLLDALPRHHGAVVHARRGGPANPNIVSRVASRHLRACGVDETLHQLRHRFATTAYLASRDLRTVQDLLGHASPTTTAIYARAPRAAAVAAVDAAGLLAA